MQPYKPDRGERSVCTAAPSMVNICQNTPPPPRAFWHAYMLTTACLPTCFTHAVRTHQRNPTAANSLPYVDSLRRSPYKERQDMAAKPRYLHCPAAWQRVLDSSPPTHASITRAGTLLPLLHQPGPRQPPVRTNTAAALVATSPVEHSPIRAWNPAAARDHQTQRVHKNTRHRHFHANAYALVRLPYLPSRLRGLQLPHTAMC